ncbi:MAG: DNA-formamidopyrimidine glycosylase family protein, partial [Planctomycetota bacterium]
MPELPEVETVRRGLQELLRPPCRVARAHCRRPDLRWPLPTDLSQRLTGRRLTAIGRRGKYLLVHCGTLTMLNHLGMTGSWRVLPSDIEPGLHDHVLLDLTDGR